MPSRDSFTWAYHDDFAELLVSKKHETTLRLLQTADIALSFARALVAKEYVTAHAMLSEEFQALCPPTALQANLEDMINFDGDESRWPTLVQVVTGTDFTEMEKWVGSNSLRFEDFATQRNGESIQGLRI